eukprot:TRINITY_DN3650_c0_g2_i1.p1 TRINITY_DN3650_c0_g2~~TRINITY_DN3650_c0_g2_i1.p1  ORF type:complete len:801 (-),score=87.61 TRINITY_DN3650_c0_g2_i1:173-2542(-)
MNALATPAGPRALLSKEPSGPTASNSASASSLSWRSFSAGPAGNSAVLTRLAKPSAAATSAWQKASRNPSTWQPVRCNATATEAAAETFTYQAEVNRLMDLIVHSLYSHREVFLRELVSNASDALDKLRFLSVTEPQLMDATAELAIRIKADPAAGTLTITDTGIGMTKEELMDSLGTIAQSGTAKFVQAIKDKQEQGGEVDSNLIGQFGVGFYSAFLVADRVTVRTKSPRGDAVWVWEAKADQSTYTIREETAGADGELPRGTSIELHLKEDQKAEYADAGRVAGLVKNYSQFISFPIYVWQEQTRDKEEEYQEAGKEGEEPVTKTRTVQEKYFDWVLANETKPIWVRTPKDVSKEEYNEFFKNTFREFLDPMAYAHFSTEGEIEFKSLLYIPGMAPFDSNEMFSGKTRNIRLYVKRVFISDQFDGELFPRYMAFVKGVVDSNDLPLNVSREILQESRVVRIMRKRLVRKTFDMIDEIAARDNTEDYKTFWQAFGRNLKLGCIEDTANHKRLAPLLRFFSSKSEDELISLDDYVSRMKPDQKTIYYIAADNVKSARSAPFLERLVQKDLEVLFLVEPVDEVAVTTLQSYQEKTFVDISKEDLDLGSDGEEDAAKAKEVEKEYQPLCDWMKGVLGEKVAKVQVSQRIATSPCVLVAGKFGWSANMERIMKAQTMGDPQQMEFMRGRRILEVNADHPIIKDLKAQSAVSPSNTQTRQMVDLLYETAHISSGFPPENPAEFGARVYEMMALAVPAAAVSAAPSSPAASGSDVKQGEVVEASEVREGEDMWK